MDPASTGTQKDSRGSAFEVEDQAKVDKTWLLQTKYIMNDLYSTDITESKLHNVDKSQDIGSVQNSSISKEFSFLSVRKNCCNTLQRKMSLLLPVVSFYQITGKDQAFMNCNF